MKKENLEKIVTVQGGKRSGSQTRRITEKGLILHIILDPCHIEVHE